MSKISLCKSNLRLSWVAILCNQIASITGEHDVVYLSKRTTTHLNLFIDVNKMVNYILANILTCHFSLFNNFREVLPEAIAKQLLQVSCTPTFHLVHLASSLLIFLK